MAYYSKITSKESGKSITDLSDGNNLIIVSSSKDLGTQAITGVSGLSLTDMLLVNESDTPENYVLGANITNINKIILSDDNFAYSNVITGQSPINLDASKLTYGVTIYGNNGSNNIVGTAFDDTIYGYIGSDTIIGGAGNDYLSGGEGADLVIFNSIAEASGKTIIDGGTGNDIDTLLVNDTVAGTFSLSTIIGMENFTIGKLNKGKIDSSGTININIDASASSYNTITITGNAGNNILTGNHYSDTFIGGLGSDTLNGLSASDTFIYNSDKELTLTEIINGGGGNNTIKLLAAGNYKFGDNNAVVNISNISLAEGKLKTGIDLSKQEEGFSILLNDGDNTVNTGAGNDAIILGSGNNKLSLGLGNNNVGLGIIPSYGLNYATGNNNITSGTGNDTFALGDGNDTIVDAGGNNTILAGAGTNNIKTGAGNDTISAYISANNTVDAGDGVNTIYATYNPPFPTLFKLNPAKPIVNIFTTGSGNDQFNLDYRTNNTIKAGAGDNIISFNYAGGPWIIGDYYGKNSIVSLQGNDIINLDVRTSNTIDLGNGDNTINGSFFGPPASNGKLIFGKNTITLGNGRDTVSLIQSGGDDIVTDNGGNGQAQTFYLGDGNNSLTLNGQDSLSSNTIFAFNGNDTITFTGNASNLNGANNINVGNGNNKVTTIGGNDSIQSGSGKDTISAGDGANLINAGLGNDSITSGIGNDLIYAGQGNDTVNAGAGNDTIYADSSYVFEPEGNGADSLIGGAGSDVFVLSHARWSNQDIINGEGGGAAPGSDIDKVILTENTDANFVNPADSTLKIDSVRVSGIEQFYIDVDADTGNSNRGNANVSLDLSKYKTAALIAGNDGKNTLIGTVGNDTIIGYSGADSLTGGKGSDTFVFNDKTFIDTITDFVSGTDKIRLDSQVFIFNGQSISSTNLAVGEYATLISAQTNDQVLLFDNTDGKLYFDYNAAGTGDPVQIATLTGVSSLVFSDFELI